jgi:threonine aldolase
MTNAPEINFRSDNVATVAPEILEALARVNRDPATSYGGDAQSEAVNEAFAALFETEVTVFPVSTGTAANALALAASVRPYGAILCHEQAHIHTAEGGATEAFTGGAKLLPLPGAQFRLTPDSLTQALGAIEWGVRNRPQPDALSITQASEHGTVYRLDEIAALGETAHRAGLKVHMDGARFANALATLGCTPAEMTWRRGVDILSFGATKNGAMSTEAIVVFDQSLVEPTACAGPGRPGPRCGSPPPSCWPMSRTASICGSPRAPTGSPAAWPTRWQRCRACRWWRRSRPICCS